MRHRLTCVLAFAIAGASGCASPAARFYTLSAAAAADGRPTAHYVVAVGPVSVPAAVDRAQLVLQTAPNRVSLDEFDRWAGPLDDGIASAVAQNLSVLLGTPNVVAGAVPGADPAYRVRIDVQRFDSVPGKEVLVDAAWAVYPATGAPRGGRTVAREAVDGTDADALVAAHSRALATVSADIAKVIGEEADRAGARPEKRRRR